MDRDYYMAWWLRDKKTLVAIKMYEVSQGKFKWNWFIDDCCSDKGELTGSIRDVQNKLLVKFNAPTGTEFFSRNSVRGLTGRR